MELNLSKGKNYSKLKEIENKIADDVKKIVAQDILPKIGQRGTALYSEDNAWYRYERNYWTCMSVLAQFFKDCNWPYICNVKMQSILY